MSTVQRKGLIYAISAPSGGGKTSLVKALCEADPELHISISHTTREQRTGEVNGKDYHFVNEAEFLALRDAGRFIEYAQVFDHYYATSKEAINQHINQGEDVLLDIDWQGTVQVQQTYPECSVSIFIMPPNEAALWDRLRARGRDTESQIEHRMERARAEMSHYTAYQYLVINDDFEKALLDIQGIVRAERLKLSHYRHYEIPK